jgi:hypothetical protein
VALHLIFRLPGDTQHCCISSGALQVGRTARPRGDGSFEFTAPSNLGAKGTATLQAVQEATVNTFSVQSFAELSAVTWERSSTLTKLLTIATVCNKAKFTISEEQCKLPGCSGHTHASNALGCWVCQQALCCCCLTYNLLMVFCCLQAKHSIQ